MCNCCSNSSCSGCCNQTPLRYKGPDVDCLGVNNCDTYDALIELFANEICDIQTALDGINGIDHISFTSSTGTPSTTPNQACETDTYTVWADVSETISLGTFTIVNPCDPAINYADVAWVDLYFGSDATGQAGRFDLPFATITAALTASNYVYLRQGQYTEAFQMVDGMVVYALPGVEFIAGGIEYGPDVAATGSFLGHARFISNSIPVQMFNNGTLRFECDYVDNINSAFYVAGTGNLVASMKYLRCSGIAAYGSSFRDDCVVELYIQEFCEGYHSPYFFAGQNTKSFNGNVKITCPVSRTLEGGPYGATRKSVVNVDKNDAGTIEVIGKIECANTTPDIADAGAYRYVLSQAGASTIKHTGDIIGGVEIGIYNGFSGNLMNMTVSGNITSDTNPMTFQNNAVGTISIELKFFNCIIQGAAPTVLGQGLSAYFWNCSFYNSTLNGDVVDINDTGTNNMILYMYNCTGEGSGTGLFVADNMTGFTETYGASFTNANLALAGTVADTWGGFAQIAALVVPKL